MKPCAYCGRENPDDAGVCRECGKELNAEPTTAPSADDVSVRLVTISRAFNPADAQLTRSRLEAAGFHPFLKNEIAGMVFEGYTMGVGGIEIQVPEPEAADAREFLDKSTE